MKTLICFVLAAASAGGAFAQAVPASRAADVAEIRRQIEIICQAFVDKDRKTLTETHGKEWRGFTPGSDHVIRGLDGYMNEATFDPRLSKGQGMVAYKLSDFDVVFYGETAVASFVLTSEVAYNGQRGTQKRTILDVFHREPAGWIQVASNTSLPPEQVMRRMSESQALGDDERTSLLAARDAVWRAWFAGDTDGLEKMLPPELVTIEPSGSFSTRPGNLKASRAFVEAGGKLTRLVFPRTEFQVYGATVILYTTYEMDLVSDGKPRTERGVGTEVFVRQADGRWVNTGWQLAALSR
jgi:ketosteroid isomerase-like protein